MPPRNRNEIPNFNQRITKKDLICHRIIILHQRFDEFGRFDAERLSPFAVAIWRGFDPDRSQAGR